ncbi:MAG: hypothetical protein H0V92_05085 [Pseudonocardiales bacterium]|nr:hypothetical protein [Pseudonocardiales bacterium]
MTAPIPTFAEYVASLGRLTPHVDPTLTTSESERIRAAAQSLGDLAEINRASLAAWTYSRPSDVPVLGLAVGLSQEKLKNALKHRFDTSGWVTLARVHSAALVEMLDEEFDLVRLVDAQRHTMFTFGDVLVARGNTRQSATRAGLAGRTVEDEIENIARGLGLEIATRTRFTGRNGRTAPCDLAVMAGDQIAIAVAAKGFDSTGSKLTDAVREVEEMADVRLPTQFIMVVIDGIGWKSRINDLRRIYRLWGSSQIDGMYTLRSLDAFRIDLANAARLRGLA